MLDLSNNNGPVDFLRVYQAGQRRLYLKVSESVGFTDKTYLNLRRRAHAAGLKVGGYHFAHATHPPRAEAEHFLAHLGRLDRKRDLRPCLDLEYGAASRGVGRWAEEFLTIVRRATGVAPILYANSSFVQACRFAKAPAALWLATYGRNDGREHPFSIPAPWRGIAAHQYSSNARVAGCSGLVDISHVFVPQAIDLPTRRSGL